MILDTTTSASVKLNIPPGTLIGLERRGVVGPFQRDAAGRRLLNEEDLDQVRAYLVSRGRTRVAA